MSDVARERPAQGPPPSSLQGFPVSRTGPGTALYRAHDHDLGPWWWSSGGPGRFDLEAPRGTCYLATTALVALRERLGPVLSARAVLPASTIERVVVSRLRLPAAARLANVRVAAAAAHGVTRELESMTPYAVPQAWAAAFDRAGFDGVRYGPRFSPGAASSIALFGAAGAPEADAGFVVDPHPVPALDVPGRPDVVPVPRRRDLKVIRPPVQPPRAGPPAGG
ncbi:RES family NAD+ phosphorylase [Angustibacter aerolatus]